MHRVASLLLVLPFLSFIATAQDALLVGNKSDDTVWRISLDDGSRTGVFASAPGPHELAILPDGRTAVVTAYGHDKAGSTLTVLDPAAGASRSIGLGRHGRPHGLRVLPGGDVLVTTEESHALLRVDPVAGEVVSAIDVGDGVGHMVAVSRDGAVAYVSKIAAGTVLRVDVAAGRVTHEVASGDGAEGIEVAPDGSVWVTNRGEDTVTVHDPDTLAKSATLDSAGFPIRVAFTADGRHALVTNARARTMTVFDAATRALVATVALRPQGSESGQSMLGQGPMPIGVVADPRRPRVYVAISGADRIAVVDTDGWRVLDYWATGRQPDALGIVRQDRATGH